MHNKQKPKPKKKTFEHQSPTNIYDNTHASSKMYPSIAKTRRNTKSFKHVKSFRFIKYSIKCEDNTHKTHTHKTKMNKHLNKMKHTCQENKQNNNKKKTKK